MPSTLVCVQLFGQRLEAQIAQGLLASQGIASIISADDAGGLYAFPTQSGFSPVKLLVNQSDLFEAEKALATRKQ